MLAVDGLRRSVEGRVLYDDLTFAVAPGERVAVRGPSGSGKTLLLRSLAGLEPLEAGRVALLGIDQAQWSMPAYRCRLMLLPQRPSLPEGSVDGVLAAPFSFRAHAGRRYEPAAARAYLERVGRSSAFLEKETARLSGGEQQLTALLRALLLEPQILLLDEPTASLDAGASRGRRGAGRGLAGALGRPRLPVDQSRPGTARTGEFPERRGGNPLMPAAYLTIGPVQLVLAALLLVVNLGLSAWLRLGLERSLLVAAVRMVVQLLLVGLVLQFVFALNQPLPVLGIALVMATLAGVAAVNRTRRRFPGVLWDSLLTVVTAAFLVTGASLLGILRVRPWFEAQYAIPLLGMVLGNTLNGISLALDRFMEGVADGRDGIESRLALGASRWEAAHGLVRESLRTGMIPTINAMMVMGVVSLPGMMTGQILAGAAPTDAVRYQIVIMFMIASATALGALGVTLLAFRALFDPRDRLRSERLRRVGARGTRR